MNRSASAPLALVTGAAGFVGSHVVEHFLAHGYRVRGIDSFDDYYDPAIKRENVAIALSHSRFALEEFDLAARDATERLASGPRPDVVIHLAGMPGVRRSLVEPGRYVRGNVVATQNVLDAFARETPVPLVFASTSSVYGNDTLAPFGEGAPCATPPNPYAATKRACELLCRAAHENFDAPVSVLRLFTVYGPRQRPDLAIHKFAAAILRDEEISIFGDGSMARDFTHVEDIVRGIACAARETTGFRTVNLGNSAPVTVCELVGRLGAALDVEPRLRFVERPPGEMNATFADVSLAMRLWSWRPAVRLDDGIRDFTLWLKSSRSVVV